MSGLLYLGSQFFIELLLSVSRLLYLGSQFFIELLLSVEQNIIVTGASVNPDLFISFYEG